MVARALRIAFHRAAPVEIAAHGETVAELSVGADGAVL
jgi:hypothetical protein